MIERRRHPRVETSKIGLLRFERSKFESCRVLNLSLGGALLRTSHAKKLPERLSLYMDASGQRLQVEVTECLVVRRSDDAVAVQFTESRVVEGIALGLR